MDIRVTSQAPSSAPAPARKELQVKRENEGVADRYDSSRALGNYASGAFVGAVGETAASVV